MSDFTASQKKELLSNPNVLQITDTQLLFTAQFKIEAVELYLKGMRPDEILIAFDFKLEYFPKEYFPRLLRKWKDRYELFGKDNFFKETRGVAGENRGRPKKVNLDDFSIDDLKALIYIQGEIIEDIKKKKALAKK